MRAISVPRPGGFAPLRGESRLQVSFAMEYEIVESPDPKRGPWKVRTRQYRYHVVAADMTEVLLFHWHPDGKSSQQGPHLHVGSSQLTPSAVVNRKAHVPTGRVALESVIELLITDLNVVPLRSDWHEVLGEGRAAYQQYRTWS